MSDVIGLYWSVSVWYDVHQLRHVGFSGLDKRTARCLDDDDDDGCIDENLLQNVNDVEASPIDSSAITISLIKSAHVHTLSCTSIPEILSDEYFNGYHSSFT